MAVPSTPPSQNSTSPKTFDWMPVALPDCSIARLHEIRRMSALGLQGAASVDWDTVHALSFDPLTGLPMGRLFEARIDHLLAHTNSEFAIVIINCQKFRLINEIYGRDVANGVLRTIAKRLNKLAQPSVFCARLRDDRFGFIVNKAHRALSDEFFASLTETLERPMRFRGHRYQLGFAVGINWRQQGQQVTASELLLDTEASLQDAKNKAAESFVSVVERPFIDLHSEQHIEQKLTSQLHSKTLPVHVNPLINLRTGAVHSYEAMPVLMDNGEAIPFDVLLKVAESSGLMLPLTEYVIRQGIKQYAEVEQRLNTYFSVAVSRVDTGNMQLMQLASEQLSRFNIPAYKFQLELHEEGHADNWRSLVDDIFELERAECPNQLKRQAFDPRTASLSDDTSGKLQVKKVFWLNRCIMQKALENSRDQHLLSTIIDLARSLGIDVMAKDLNDDAHRDLALSLGILFGRGPLVGESAPLAMLR